jgi:hypothetical protein
MGQAKSPRHTGPRRVQPFSAAFYTRSKSSQNVSEMSSSSSSSSSSSAPAPHEAVEDSEPYTFVDKSSADDLICIICRELATDAVGCSTQQHLMCKKCAIQIVTERQPCPFKCNKRAVLVTVCMGDFVRRLKNKLRVECNDCKKQMELGNFRSHSCPVARQSCAVPGCNYVGHAKSMAHHDVAEAVKHSGLYRAAFGHLRQMIEGMTTLEQKASGKRKASDVGKEEANKKAKKPMLKKPIDFYLEHKEANESIDVDMDGLQFVCFVVSHSFFC